MHLINTFKLNALIQLKHLTQEEARILYISEIKNRRYFIFFNLLFKFLIFSFVSEAFFLSRLITALGAFLTN